MRMRTSLLVTLFAASFVCGCKKTERTEPEPSGPSTPTDEAPAAEQREVVHKPPVSRTGQPITVIARLAQEAKQRPTGTPSVEDVFKALDAGGITLKDVPKQVLAAQMLASFCKVGSTPKGMGVSVCEYS